MFSIEIFNLVYAFVAEEEIIRCFEKRVTFNRSEKQADIKVEFKTSKLTFNDAHFLDSFEPQFEDRGFFREVPYVCRLFYSIKERKILVEYNHGKCLVKENMERMIDASLQFVSLSLMYYGILPMHAACVEKEKKGIMIVGNSGAGKTTLEYNLIRRGLNFYADDIVYINKKLLLSNSSEHILCLRKDVVQNLLDDAKDYMQINLSGDKVALNMIEQMSKAEYVQPHIIIFPIRGTQKSGLTIKELTNHEIMLRLINLTVSTGLPLELKKDYFDCIKLLSKKVQAYEVIRSQSCDKIETEEMCQKIIALLNNMLDISN